jgi:hypothetical protein
MPWLQAFRALNVESPVGKSACKTDAGVWNVGLLIHYYTNLVLCTDQAGSEKPDAKRNNNRHPLMASIKA